MDDTERLVEAYLRHLGYTDIVYEPDGNVPPDFLVGARIAVEARRLNEHDSSLPQPRGLEEEDIPLLFKFKNLLASLGPPVAGQSWFVFYRYRRPVERWRTLGPRIHEELERFRDSGNWEPIEISFGPRLSMQLFRTGSTWPNMFLLGGYSDGDSGGWLLELIQRNLRLCIEEKSRKTAHLRPKYSEWWLVMADYIGFGSYDLDWQSFREQVEIIHDWEKVVLLDPNEPSWSVEI
jgi:hypothetical protein